MAGVTRPPSLRQQLRQLRADLDYHEQMMRVNAAILDRAVGKCEALKIQIDAVEARIDKGNATLDRNAEAVL